MSLEHFHQNDALETARRFSEEQFPFASLVLLCGSWATGRAHPDSDLDLVVLDESVERVFFEGISYEGWIIEVCAIGLNYVREFFEESAKYRSAPVPIQVVDGIVVKGSSVIAERVRTLAREVTDCGPGLLSDADRSDTQYDITVLRDDLRHASRDALPALAAYAHVRLSRAVLDASGTWRAERKVLRRAVAKVDSGLADRLDEALLSGCSGDAILLVEICDVILERFGGPSRTYPRFPG